MKVCALACSMLCLCVRACMGGCGLNWHGSVGGHGCGCFHGHAGFVVSKQCNLGYLGICVAPGRARVHFIIFV